MDDTTIPRKWVLIAKQKLSEEIWRYIFAHDKIAVLNEFEKSKDK